LAISLKNVAPNQGQCGQRPVSVVVADDHPVVLHGIDEILRAQPDINIVAACSAGRAATAAIQQFIPDVAMLNIVMPDLDGLDVLSRLAKDRFETKVLLLTGAATDDRILAAIAGGAKGLLFKDTAPDSLVDCVHVVAKGKQWFAADLAAGALERETGCQVEGKCLIGALTPRQG
jgi:DNA-binding NarL/FixJ family response regulator